MRAPPDSMKPTTGAPARPASRSTRTIVSACARRASRRGTTGPARSRATGRPSTRPAPPMTPSPGARAFAHAPRRRRRERRSVQRAGVAERLEPLAAARASPASRTAIGVVRHAVTRPPGRARRCGRRTRTSSTARSAGLPFDVQRRGPSGHVVEVHALLGLLPASVGGAIRSRRARRWRRPRPRRRRRAGGRSPTSVEETGISSARVAERELDRLRLGAVVERRRGAVRVDVVDVLRLSGRRPQRHARSPRAAPGPSGVGAVRWYASDGGAVAADRRRGSSRRAPAAFSASSSTSTRRPRPSRSRRGGRRTGARCRVATARRAPRRRPWTAASAPPRSRR